MLGHQPRQRDIVDGQDLIAGAQSGFRGRRAFHGLQNGHPPGDDADDGAEAFGLALLHLLELLELIGIEKDRVRIERAQHAGDGALIEGLVGRDGIGRLLVQNP